VSLVRTLTRRTLPSTVIVLSQLDGAARAGAAARHALGRRGRVELYFAWDDAASAVALLGLAERVRGRSVQLVLRPVVKRGIPDDPAVLQKREYAIADARRRARRLGFGELSRGAPLAAGDTAFLADWAAAERPPVEACVAAMRRLWFESDGRVERAAFADLIGGTDAGARVADAVRANERAMAKRKPYDTPAAWIHGQWFFAHERLDQIGDRLDALGWVSG
jgi:2-hydroxychromene-2-carboxylate isomerase